MRSFLLLLLSACVAETPADTAPAEACTLAEAAGTEACPVDTCADACASVEAGVACCVAAHGYGDPGAVSLERTSYCATPETYDPSDYLSEAAARCAAQVYGLPAGLGECYATLVVCDGGARADWYVQSRREEGCGYATYDGLVVDAVEGTVETGFVEHSDGICDE
ncbi:MAG: hypothetical protein Q7U06_00030 [Pseudomonadota bacterium]|nr:hypothetical protein [Pseudomonadota bacterium]